MITEESFKGCKCYEEDGDVWCGLFDYLDSINEECPCMNCLVKIMCEMYCDKYMKAISNIVNKAKRVIK